MFQFLQLYLHRNKENKIETDHRKNEFTSPKSTSIRI